MRRARSTRAGESVPRDRRSAIPELRRRLRLLLRTDSIILARRLSSRSESTARTTSSCSSIPGRASTASKALDRTPGSGSPNFSRSVVVRARPPPPRAESGALSFWIDPYFFQVRSSFIVGGIQEDQVVAPGPNPEPLLQRGIINSRGNRLRLAPETRKRDTGCLAQLVQQLGQRNIRRSDADPSIGDGYAARTCRCFLRVRALQIGNHERQE